MSDYSLANKILNMKTNDEFECIISDGECEFDMGIKKIREFDCDLVVMAVFGGGFVNIIYIHEFTTTEDIYKNLKERYISIGLNIY